MARQLTCHSKIPISLATPILPWLNCLGGGAMKAILIASLLIVCPLSAVHMANGADQENEMIANQSIARTQLRTMQYLNMKGFKLVQNRNDLMIFENIGGIGRVTFRFLSRPDGTTKITSKHISLLADMPERVPWESVKNNQAKEAKPAPECFSKFIGIAGGLSRALTRNKKACLGMTTSEVRGRWGPPHNVSRTVSDRFHHQTWFYEIRGGEYLSSTTAVLFFEDGLLKAVQRSDY